MLTGKYGLVIDNLVSATVVLANGEIKQASKTKNADLFWALQVGLDISFDELVQRTCIPT